MLTKNDLDQIRGVVREEVTAEVGEQLKAVKADLGNQLDTVTTEIGTLKAVTTEIGVQLKATEKRLSRKLRKVQNSLIQYHDEYAIYLRGRIEKLEEHTGLVKPNKN